MEQKDHILVDQFLQSRSEKAFKKLYRTKTPRLYMMALRLCKNNVQEAEELVQETWIRAVEKLSGFQWKATLTTWMTGILLNINKEKFRKKTRDVLAGELIIKNELKIESKIDVMDLEKAIESLPNGYRQVLILHDVEGYKHREVAELLSIDEGTSKSQLFQARRAVRKFLNDK